MQYRVEAVATSGHWDAYYLADKGVPLARGWYRQDDFPENAVLYDHNLTLALAAYNGGETNVDAWLAEAHAAGVRFTVDSIPFPQTRAYVERVEHVRAQYAKDYGL